MSDNITPTTLVKKLRENMNNNGTLRSLFASQFLSKLEMHELDGLVKNINKEKENRHDAEVAKLKKQLEEMGYEVTKK
jgi:hypothetical protein